MGLKVHVLIVQWLLLLASTTLHFVGPGVAGKQHEQPPSYQITARIGRHDKTVTRITVTEDELDANRSIVVGNERFFIPRPIPKLSHAEKWELLQNHFASQQLPVPPRIQRKFAKHINGSLQQELSKRSRRPRRVALSRRSCPIQNANVATVDESAASRGNSPQRSCRNGASADSKPTNPRKSHSQRLIWPEINFKQLISINNNPCPTKFDAITRAFDRKLYLFAGKHVYLNWYDLGGLYQRATYLIEDVFPRGPRTVTAALTNSRSSNTILFHNRTMYRFRWHHKFEKFYLAKDSPRELPENVAFTPKYAFQWTFKDGTKRIVLSDGKQSAQYQPFTNYGLPLHSHHIPNVPDNTIGIALADQTVLFITVTNMLKVYDMNVSNVIQEYPISVKDFVACLPNENSATGAHKNKASYIEDYP